MEDDKKYTIKDFEVVGEDGEIYLPAVCFKCDVHCIPRWDTDHPFPKACPYCSNDK